MARRMKEMVIDHLGRRFGEVDHAVMVDFSKLTGEENRMCRIEMRKAGISVNVVKNSLVRRVFAARGLELPEGTLSGPTAVLVGGTDAITTSKAIAAWRKKNKKEIPLKGGLLDGAVLGPVEAERLTTMPSVRETHQMLVSVVAAPLSQFVGVMQSILAGVPGVLQAIADKKKEEGE
jgi:large subunit ribosomal protein L10